MYFLISIQKVNGTYPKSIAEYSVIEEARSAYHQTLASNYISSLDGFTVMIIDELGNVVEVESWYNPNL